MADIPDDILKQYETVISMIRGGYLTEDNYQNMVLNENDVPLTMNQWYIIDISGRGVDFDIRGQYIDILYPLDCKSGHVGRVSGYHAQIWQPLLNRDLSPFELIFTKSYGVSGCNYIPLKLIHRHFINWVNKNPFEVTK